MEKEVKRDKKDKKNFLELAKILCLLIPTILASMIFMMFTMIIFGRYFTPYSLETRMIALENINGTLLAVIGIAVTAWVGINIYNTIERREVEEINAKIKKLKKSIGEMPDEWARQVDEQIEEHWHVEELRNRDIQLLALIGFLSLDPDIEFRVEFVSEILNNLEPRPDSAAKLFEKIEDYIDFARNKYVFMDDIGDEEDWGGLRDKIRRSYHFEEMVVVDERTRELLKAIGRSKDLSSCEEDVEKILRYWA